MKAEILSVLMSWAAMYSGEPHCGASQSYLGVFTSRGRETRYRCGHPPDDSDDGMADVRDGFSPGV